MEELTLVLFLTTHILQTLQSQGLFYKHSCNSLTEAEVSRNVPTKCTYKMLAGTQKTLSGSNKFVYSV